MTTYRTNGDLAALPTPDATRYVAIVRRGTTFDHDDVGSAGVEDWLLARVPASDCVAPPTQTDPDGFVWVPFHHHHVDEVQS